MHPKDKKYKDKFTKQFQDPCFGSKNYLKDVDIILVSASKVFLLKFSEIKEVFL